MTSDQRYREMLEELTSAMSALCDARDMIMADSNRTDPKTVEWIGVCDAIVANRDKWSAVKVTPAPPMESFDFFAGAIYTLSHMASVAEGTQGARVWEALFTQMRQSIVESAAKKGFAFK